MHRDHPTDGDIASLLQHQSYSGGAQRTAQVVRHLLADCSYCTERVQGFANAAEYDYSPAFAGAERALEAFFGRAKSSEVPVESLLDELQALPAEMRVEEVKRDKRFAHPQVIDRIIEHSHMLRYKSPSEMLSLANLAVVAAEACPVDAAGSEKQLFDLKAKGWMQYANALKVCTRFDQADTAFTQASACRAKGTGDPLLRASLLEQMASLRTGQNRYREATKLAEEAGAIYQDLEENHSLASTMILRAVAAQYANEPEEAIAVLNRAIPLIDPEKNPHLLLAACHNLVLSYISVDRPEQALSLYFETRSLYKDFEDDLILLRVGWQEGQLLRDLGHLQAAETALLQARKGFMERSLAHDVALVSLDLAWVYVKLGRTDQLKQTVTEALPLFQALRVGREAIAALLQLQHAEGQEHKALELIRLLNSRLSPLSQSNTNK